MRSNSAKRRASILSLLLSSFIEAFFRGSHNTGPFLQRDMQIPAQPLHKLNPWEGLDFNSPIPSPACLRCFKTAMEIVSVCTAIPIYFGYP